MCGNEIKPDTSMHASEVLLDRLADALYAADEILSLLRKPDEPERPHAAWLERFEPDVLRIYDEVNGIMKRLSA